MSKWSVNVEATWTIRTTIDVVAEDAQQAGARASEAVQLGMTTAPAAYVTNGVATAEAVFAREVEDDA